MLLYIVIRNELLNVFRNCQNMSLFIKIQIDNTFKPNMPKNLAKRNNTWALFQMCSLKNLSKNSRQPNSS